jgi:hypothetical protein
MRILIAVGLGAAFLSATWPLFAYWSLLIAFFVAAATFAGGMASRVELRATKFELVARGNLGRRGSQMTRVVCTGDVRSLEFRDLAGQRSGLYAVTEKTAYCILPFLDYSQTKEVIRAIEAKFPGLAEGWQAQSPATGDFLALGLGRAK